MSDTFYVGDLTPYVEDNLRANPSQEEEFDAFWASI